MEVEIESAWARRPDYRIELVPCHATARVLVGDLVVAESGECIVLREEHHVDRLYFPERDVRWEHFRPTDHHTVCPFKGRADYWTLTAGDAIAENVVWAYRDPFREVAGIAGYACFYHERVDVVLDERRADGSVVRTPFPPPA